MSNERLSVRLTKYDCMLIARELHRLQKEDRKQELPDTGRWLTMKEAMAFTGLSESTLYHCKKIPRSKVGRLLRFPEKGLQAYMANQREFTN